ncbi:MAG: DUF3362 domain-containing protein, partial [Methylococcales bacterium]|nr:DUF3362 domain-containing protein [Methylococcales bacterium]
LRDALKKMGKANLIGNGKQHLIPSFQPKGTSKPKKSYVSQPKNKRKNFRTKHVR